MMNCIFNIGIFFKLIKSLLIFKKKEFVLDNVIKYLCILKKYLFVNSMYIE